MKQIIDLRIALTDGRNDDDRQLPIFALLNLGIIQSLASGVISAEDAAQLFYNAENCLYVRKHLKNKIADTIMSHGVQLRDLFDFLPAAEAHREFTSELEILRSLCLKLFNRARPATLRKRKIIANPKP